MVFANPKTSRIYLDEKIIEEAKDIEYLGSIISSIKFLNQDAPKKTSVHKWSSEESHIQHEN